MKIIKSIIQYFKDIKTLLESIEEKLNSIESDMIELSSTVGRDTQDIGYLRVDR